jgi:hypothetical protein
MGWAKGVAAVLCVAGVALSAYALNVEMKSEAAKQLGEEYEVSLRVRNVCVCGAQNPPRIFGRRGVVAGAGEEAGRSCGVGLCCATLAGRAEWSRPCPCFVGIASTCCCRTGESHPPTCRVPHPRTSWPASPAAHTPRELPEMH